MLATAARTAISMVEAEIDRITAVLKRQGVFLRAGKNVHDLQQHIERQPDRPSLHDQFDPDGDMDGAVDAFWICGFDCDGELIHTQAAHLLDLRGMALADHIVRTLPKYFPKTPELIRSSGKAKVGPKLQKMSGQIAYHGEMWLQDSLRDKGTATLLNRLGMYMCVREWDPDAIFGLMSWVLACDGFNMRIGYTHSEAMTVEWDKVSDKSSHQVWAVFMEREDINFLLELPAVEFASVLRRNFS